MITRMDRFLYLVPVLTFAVLANACPSRVCRSEACKKVKERLDYAMDPEADPCDDFEQYACGGFFEKEVMLPSLYSVFLAESNQTLYTFHRVKALLNEEPTKKSPFKTDELARRFYQSCMDERLIERDSLQEVKKLYQNIGGFPALEGASWIGEEFNWWDMISRLPSYGIWPNIILRFSVSVDAKNTKSTVMVLDQQYEWNGVYRGELAEGFTSPLVKKYYEYMVDAVKLLGATNKTAHADMKEALQFEIDLANITDGYLKRLNQTELYNERTIGDLEGQPGYPSPLKGFIQKIFDSVGVSGVNVGDDDRVIVGNLAYAKKLDQLVKRTSPRAIANYICWKVYTSFDDILGEKPRSVKDKYLFATRAYNMPPRFANCGMKAGVNTFGDGLVLAVGSLYVRDHLNAKDKKQAEVMAEKMKEAFGDMLEKNQWMDGETKKHAIEKLDAMEMTMGYPAAILDPGVLNAYFEGLTMTNNFLKNLFAVEKFLIKRYLENIKIPVDRDHFYWHQWILIALNNYQYRFNYIDYPASLLQDPKYNPEQPMYMNFGAIGADIGSKITSGFDDYGSQYDKNGNLVNWWEKDTLKKFDEKGNCVADQYGNFKSEQAGLNINGNKTKGSNIADIAGVKTAYLAYKYYKRGNRPEETIEGYNFTPEQFFWLSYAHSVCGKYTTERLKQLIKNGWTAPSKFRIMGSLANNANFAGDFNCPLGSRMNPRKKCNVW